jgi:hypothetical protein
VPENRFASSLPQEWPARAKGDPALAGALLFGPPALSRGEKVERDPAHAGRGPGEGPVAR